MSVEQLARGHIWVGMCACGWRTLHKATRPEKCEACGADCTEVKSSEQVAEEIAFHVQNVSEHVCRIAEKQGIFLFQLSTNVYLVMKYDAPYRIAFKDETSRVYHRLRLQFKGTHKDAMGFLHKNVKALPAYLHLHEGQ